MLRSRFITADPPHEPHDCGEHRELCDKHRKSDEPRITLVNIQLDPDQRRKREPGQDHRDEPRSVKEEQGQEHKRR